MELTPAEGYLLDRKVVSRTSQRLRKCLGCLGCALAGDERAVYAYKIVRCRSTTSNIADTGTVTPILQRLEGAGLLTSELEEGPPGRRLYTTPDTPLGYAFAEHLTPPTQCPLTANQPSFAENECKPGATLLET